MTDINIKIRAFGLRSNRPQVATGKFMLRSSAETARGCRWLEPGEVVAMPEDEARNLLIAGGEYIEQTIDAPNRPLYFRNAAEAAETSSFSPKHPGRAEHARKKMAEVFAEMLENAEAEAAANVSQPPARADIGDLSIEELEQMIAAKRGEHPEQLVIPDPLEAQLDKELEDYQPGINAVSPAEIEGERRAALAEAEAEAEKPAKRERKRRKS